MESFTNDTSSGAATLHKLNHCHIFLQAVTLSDILFDGAGTEVLCKALIGFNPVVPFLFLANLVAVECLKVFL
jgi:hypothetical protein